MADKWTNFYRYGYLFFRDVKINKTKDCFVLRKNNNIIKIALKHKLYLYDIAHFFDFYFSAVEPVLKDNYYIADFSKTLSHKLIGYDLHNIICPSFPEPVYTTNQYIEFADLDENSVVLDLGGYSGLTSILFDKEISKNNINAKGRVISVEADIINFSCLVQNIQTYKTITNRNIDFLYAAVSDKNGMTSFLADGSMGSNANINLRDALKIEVTEMTLSSIAEKYNLQKVDFIKCDIEGAEKYIFNDSKFFEKYSPKILVESHYIGKSLTVNSVRETLEKYGYCCNITEQNGFDFPLMECIKP